MRMVWFGIQTMPKISPHVFEDGRLSLAIEEYRNGNTIAVRYEKKDEDGVVWDTDYAEDFTSCM